MKNYTLLIILSLYFGLMSIYMILGENGNVFWNCYYYIVLHSFIIAVLFYLIKKESNSDNIFFLYGVIGYEVLMTIFNVSMINSDVENWVNKCGSEKLSLLLTLFVLVTTLVIRFIDRIVKFIEWVRRLLTI